MKSSLTPEAFEKPNIGALYHKLGANGTVLNDWPIRGGSQYAYYLPHGVATGIQSPPIS